MSILDTFLGILAPHSCIECGLEGVLLCVACQEGLKPIVSRCYRCGRVTEDFRTCPACRHSSDLFKVHVAFAYDDAAKELIHRLKFMRAQAAANDIADALARRFAFGDVVITHVPTAPSRARQRGYDQAALIARALARRTGAQYAPLLARVGKQRQVGQTRTTRRQQMRTAFRVTRPLLLNKPVLLVDDVLTTGSTCEAAARILRASGARRVSAVVFAAA